MKVVNIDELKVRIRPFLKKYLHEQKTDIIGNKFRCPNYKIHKNQDTTPSASFFSGDEHWNCFVCPGAGDIFTAAHYLENKPLKGPEFISENVVYLAKKFNIHFEMSEETNEEKYQKKIYRLLETVAKLSNMYLEKKAEKKIHKYIAERGWNKITKQFCLGYIPSQKLYKYLIKEGYDDRMIVDAGLTVFKEDKIQLPFPVIENRLVIPFKNYFGKTSAFVSREIEEGYAKYLHSHNSIVHQKSKDLFNLNEAKKYSDELYIVESNASVLTLFAHDVKNCVALSGKDLTAEQYDLLVRLDIKKIMLCLDNDKPGIEATEKIVYTYKDKTDIDICIKELPKEIDDKKLKDPDDFIKKFGIEKFNVLSEISSFDWALNNFVSTFNDDTKKEEADKFKEILVSLLLIEPNFLKREKLIKKFCEKTDYTQKAVLQELDKFASQKDLITSVKEVIESKESLTNNVGEFEEHVWKRSENLLGFDTGWPLFNKIFDGLQDGLYTIGGRTNIGKSAVLLSLMYNLLKINKDKIYILYFNIDDSVFKCIGRLVSMESKIPINWVKNPKYKIKMNDYLEQKVKDKMLIDREEAINYVKSLTNSLSFKSYVNMEEIEKTIKIYNKIAENERKKLVVFIDKIHNIGSYKKLQKRELTEYVSVTLKNLVNAFEIPIIGSLEVIKSSILLRPTEGDFKETAKLADDSDAALLLYNDMKINSDSSFTFNEDGKIYPIIEASIPKNKLNDLSGYDVKIFFKFYPHFSLVVECDDADQKKFNSIKT